MPRPTNKDELQKSSKENFDKLLLIIDSLPVARLKEEFPDEKMYRNIRDVLAHLHHWNTMVLDWYETGERGEKPAIPGEGYTWKTLPELNVKIWEKYNQVPLEEVRIFFEKSFADVYALILTRTNDELFERKRYQWTGSTSLGAYLVSCTSSHYDWAIKKIKKAFK
jgi:hypothetical protein